MNGCAITVRIDQVGDAVVGEAVLPVALLVLYDGLNCSNQQHKEERDGRTKG